jgi:hypothetical protein
MRPKASDNLGGFNSVQGSFRDCGIAQESIEFDEYEFADSKLFGIALPLQESDGGCMVDGSAVEHGEQYVGVA